MTSKIDIDKIIDTSGTRCPLPLLRAKAALAEMQVGEVLQVIATDPAAKSDFDAMLSFVPHEMLEFREGDADQQPRTDVFILRKG